MLDTHNIYICTIMEIKIKLKTLSLCVLMWCCIKSPRCVSFHRGLNETLIFKQTDEAESVIKEI